MAKLDISIPHTLTEEIALDRVRNLLGEVKSTHGDKISGLSESWNGNTGQFSFTAAGFKISGTLRVSASDVNLNGTLPFAASFFRGTIESTIREEAEKILS